MFLLRSNNRANVLLDSEINHLIAVISEDNINKIFADVVNIPLDSGN